MGKGRRCSTAALSVVFAASVALAGCRRLGPGSEQARGTLRVTLAGIPLGSGTWVIDVAPDQYTAVASGRTSGLVKLISDGSGSSGSRGAIQGASLVPTSYVSSTVSDRRADDVRMTLRAGTVKDVSIEPPTRRRRIACRSPTRTARASPIR